MYWAVSTSSSQAIVSIRLSLKKLFALEFHQRCRLAPRSQNIFYILLYYARGKWYFQSKIGQFGPIQASCTKLENGVSLSTGIVEQNVKYVLWSGSQCASLVKFKSKKFLLRNVFTILQPWKSCRNLKKECTLTKWKYNKRSICT